VAFRLYIVPVVVESVGPFPSARLPKYFTGSTRLVTSGQAWTAMDYGAEPRMVVGADLTAGDDALVVAESDVFALPFDLSTRLTNPQANNAESRLEAANIPAGWVSNALTWTQVIRTVLGIFSFLQRYAVVYGQQTGTAAPTLFTGGASLNTTFGSLPLAVRDAFTATAQSFNLSTASLTAGTTLRTILEAMADQFQSRPYTFGGTVI
jgi:hypothetical protein